MTDLNYIIKASQSLEMILNFAGGVDLRLNCEDREEFLKKIKHIYAQLCKEKVVKIYAIPGSSLKDYKNTNNKNNFECEPD